MKRTLAFLCALALMLSLVPGAAFAATQDLQAEIDAGAETIVLEADASDITVTRDTTIDLNGHDLSGVTVLSGTLYLQDSETADYTVADGVYGHVTNVTGNVKAAEGYLQVGDSFHAVNLDIYAMTLRASNVGVYYKSYFAADEIVAAQVESFGVALSVVTAPNASNLETYCGYSQFTGFEAGEGANSVGTSTLLKGIMKAANGDTKNAKNAAMPVYGRAYIKTAEGYFFGETVKRSLQEQVEAIDKVWNKLTDAQKTPVLAMLEGYTSVMENWNIPNIRGIQVPGADADIEIPIEVTAENGVVTEAVTVEANGVSVTVPAGTKLAENATGLTVIVTEKETSEAGLTLEESEVLMPMDVHVEGLAADNTAPLTIYLGKVMAENLNMGNYAVYHVENGKANEMVLIPMDAEFTAHNQYKYSLDGELTLYMATFSEVAVVSEDPKWEGEFDYSWYDASKTELEIRNADQLAALSAIVGGMKKVTDRVDGKYTYSEEIIQDSFSGKTIKLLANIDLGDSEEKNDPNKIFYPIGYWNNEGTYERKPLEERETVSSGFYTFNGTFDGNGHTISNFYHNTWEMKGDHNWYSAVTEQYYRDGMGLFGRVYKGTVKNLTVRNFKSDGEIATTGVIAAYADGATFENIAIFDCNPRVYNIGNGGIVGCVGWYAKEADLKTTFKNITVDNSNKISALWGSYDVPCGGIVGQYYPASGQTSANKPANGGIHMENCHVSAQLDVFNDVCANYQYYAYRYAGMLIGSVSENETIDGHVYPKMDKITAEGCTVHFGTWNDYYYCELVDNTTASYTHDYQMSRLVEIKAIDGTTITYLDGTTDTVPASGRANYVIVDYTKGHGTGNATCYHFKDGAVWTHDMAGTQAGIDENGDGKDDLKEDKQHIYREFNNLVTGYGWGVTTKAVGDLDGVTILDREEANSVVKFESIAAETYTSTKTVTIGELFKAKDQTEVAIVGDKVQVTVSPANPEDKDNTASGTYVPYTEIEDATDWTKGTLTFTGIGAAKITITDYYFCTSTTIDVTIEDKQNVVKFDDIFPNENSLHRVGNHNAVTLGQLFRAMSNVTIGDGNSVDVEIETIYGASGKYTKNADWTKGSIKFSGTGIVKVTITDNDYCETTELILEVVDAVNVTVVTDATANNVVLLNDAGLSSFTVSGRYTFYGNGFTLTYNGNGQYLNNGLKQGVVTVSENGTLDNVRIKATIYPKAYMYYGSTLVGDYVQGGPSSVEGDKTRYHYQLSAVAASGNATISNCYIYGGRNNIFINTGDVTVKDTVLECAPVANVQIQSNASHTVTFENVTTIQKRVSVTSGDTSKVMLGAGILVGPETTENPTIVLNGYFKQYNWVTQDDANAVSDTKITKAIIQSALNATAYNHTVNGQTASNLGIIFMNTYEATVTNDTGLPYVLDDVDLKVNNNIVNGQVCSVQNATAEQIYSDVENADRSSVNGLYQPQFKYPADLGGQYIEKDSGDEHCYREGDTIHVLFPSGDTKELDLAKLVDIQKYTGQNLNLVITCKDESGNAVTVTAGKVSLSAAGQYTVTYTVTDTLFYDKDGNTISGKSETYSWDVAISVALKDTKVPDARFEFDATKQKMGYYKPTIGDVKQYLPFLAGLKIYDYNGKTEYLRFDGSADFNKVASITITGYASNKASVEVKLTDGGVINTQFLARANSGGGSTYTGKIKTSKNTIYFVTDSGTSNKDTTTTAAYWYVDFYKFTGNNGVAIQSGQQTFNSTGSSASTPSGNFSTTIKYTVTYDANEGNCGQTTGYATSVSTAVTLPTPTRSGYLCSGWFTAASGGTRVGGAGDSYTPSANITLYAQWGKPSTVTYNANGGSVTPTSQKYEGTALTLPTPTRDGYWCTGWYDAASGGNKIGDAGATYNPADEITLYAHWQEAISYTVTYNANGGSCGTASATYQGSALTLPTPTRTGYTFNGWYTAASGGTRVGGAGDSYTPSANITLYAQWQINSYTITVTTNNATVKVNGTTVNNNGTVPVQYGAQVTVEVTYSQRNSQSTTIKGTDGTTYTSPFNMPAQDVTINATSSSSCVASDTLVTLADGSQKRIDQITYEDQLLVWDFYQGKYAVVPAAIIFDHGYDNNTVIELNFDDGTSVKVVNLHQFFDADLNGFVSIDAESVADYVGHQFVKQNSNGYELVTLTDYTITEEYCEAWGIISAEHYNIIVEGMLSTDFMKEDFALFNYFKVGENMKFDEEQMQTDIEKYGLYTYADFEQYLTREQFAAFNVQYFKIAVGKGEYTYEGILALIDTYLNN